MVVQGVRGATTVEKNTKEAVFAAVQDLLYEMVTKNKVNIADIGAAIFSATPDLNAAFPAAAARKMGWETVPLFGTQELEVEDAPEQCVRVLLLLNTDKQQGEMIHVYLGGAARLRPDLTKDV